LNNSADSDGHLEQLSTVFQFPSHIRQEDGTRDQFMAIFHEMDADSSGNISLVEMMTYLKSKGLFLKPQNPNTKPSSTPTKNTNIKPAGSPTTNTRPHGTAYAGTQASDTRHAPRHASNTQLRSIDWAFRFMDKDGSGSVKKNEMIRALRENQKIADMLQLPRELSKKDSSRQEFERLFDHIDEDGSGDVSRDEFVAFFRGRQSREEQQKGTSNYPIF